VPVQQNEIQWRTEKNGKKAEMKIKKMPKKTKNTETIFQ
jgi:hypothetical protein